MKRNTYLTHDTLRKSILELLASSESPLTKNQIARHLGIRGDNRIILKQVLAQLETEGNLERGSRRRLIPATLSFAAGHVLVVEIIEIGEDAQLIAIPLDWTAETPAPKIELLPSRRTHTKHSLLGVGAHVLVRLQTHTKDLWHGEVLKKLEKKAKTHLGIFTHSRDGGGRLSPCHRKDTFPGVKLLPAEAKGLLEGDIVAYSVSTAYGPKIHNKIGRIDNPKSFSQIAIYAHHIPHTFSKEAILLSEQGKVPSLGQRTDFTKIPLVTIDGEDARDFDDAVWACADNDPRNKGGWRILVAIADVAYYVRPGDALDHAAKERGNSVYFPDCVVPMLPEALSNDLCSLKPNVNRACMAIEMIVSSEGKVKSHHVKRGLMCSRARLTYAQVQKALDGYVDEVTGPLLETVIKPLYGAYKSLAKERARRGTLDIEQQERKVIFGSNGHIERIIPAPRYESHRLIEEFMIAANVAAARTLLIKKWPCLYRIHDAPDALRIVNLRQILRKMKLTFTKAKKPHPRQFNEVLTKTKGTPVAQMISDLVLRSQAQARYSPLNIGHFGLNLTHYAHFTSPIRRYSDLIVHRSLISALQLGDDGLTDRSAHLTALADHISATERTAAVAEREVQDRFIIAYHLPHIGKVFPATIVGVTKNGIFAAISDTGAQGFIPRHLLRGDVFHYDEGNHRLLGRRTQTSYQLGSPIEVRLQSADISTNSLLFELVDNFEFAKQPHVGHKKNTSNKQLKKFKKSWRKR
ncbi:MAG: ribonuclease R [Alphaproteobacteria bacterium]|nr:ribonuclease R [Alphaproteobacteria bacterium]